MKVVYRNPKSTDQRRSKSQPLTGYFEKMTKVLIACADMIAVVRKVLRSGSAQDMGVL